MSANQYPSRLSFDLAATVAIGANDSDEIDLQGTTLVGVFVPSNFDGTQLKFKAASAPGGTFLLVIDGFGVDATKTVAASRYLPLDPAMFAGVRHLKLSAVTAQAGTDTLLTLATRPV